LIGLQTIPVRIDDLARAYSILLNFPAEDPSVKGKRYLGALRAEVQINTIDRY
jgi:hypothetical protein